MFIRGFLSALDALKSRVCVVDAGQGGSGGTVGALTLLSSMATKEVLEAMAIQYSKETGRTLAPESIGGVDAAKRVRAGDPADIVVLAAGAIDQLIADGLLLAGSRIDLVRSAMAVAVRAGAARPALGSAEQVRQAILQAGSVSYSTGPSGVYLEKLMKQWGIYETVEARLVPAPAGVPVGGLIASGKAELGFQQFSELHNVAGIDVLGPLPAEIQLITTFSAGIGARCRRVAEARAALSFMASASLNELKQRCGMESA